MPPLNEQILLTTRNMQTINSATTSAIKKQLGDYYKKLSGREKVIIAVAILMILISIIYPLQQEIRSAFSAQDRTWSELEDESKKVAASLARYAKLKNRQAAIELSYKEVEIKEGALSYLENLVRNKAGIASGFTIRDRPPREFAGSYEQTPFTIKFVITDYPRLIEFLKEITHGQHPMLLAGINVKKRPAGDALEVEIDVSGVRKITRGNQT